MVNSASMLGSFVSAAVLLLLWRRMSFRLGLTSVFRVVYPLVITGFLLLPFLGAGYLNLFAAFTYMVFSLVLMLMMTMFVAVIMPVFMTMVMVVMVPVLMMMVVIVMIVAFNALFASRATASSTHKFSPENYSISICLICMLSPLSTRRLWLWQCGHPASCADTVMA